MSFVVVIPARFGSTRLPGKPLADLCGKPLIAHVVDRAQESNAGAVIVATDDQRIVDALENYDCDVCLTRSDHPSGSDRIAEVVELMSIPDDQIVVNVQGDEPIIPARLINEVAAALADAPQAVMATAAQAIRTEDDLNNPNMVKVVIDQTGRALYFSRAPIPFARDASFAEIQSWHHIGIYAYTAKFLKQYASLAPSQLEQTECLEQLRVMDNGETIMVQTIDYDAGIGVDTQADLERVSALLKSRKQR